MQDKSPLLTPLKYLKGVGEERAELLQKELGLFSFYDLLHHFPFRYIDKQNIIPIKDITEDMPFIQTGGKIESIKTEGEGKKMRLKAILRDHTGRIELIWFNKIKIIREIVKPGMVFLAFGKPGMYKNMFTITHPEMELMDEVRNPATRIKLQPIYSTTEKLKNFNTDSKGILRLMTNLFEKIPNAIEENLPQNLLAQFRLMPREEAYHQIHFPDNIETQKRAASRLKFEELFFIQMHLLQQKNNRRDAVKGFVMDKVGDYVNDFYANYLPFNLTEAQKRVIKEIRADMKTGSQMNRLLQGDVGSGKTIVALMSILIALDNKMQCALMAPTEILATQHFKSLSALTFGMGINIKLLTGSTSAKERKLMLKELAEGTLHIIIGTHALIEDRVQFANLGLVVIDEQHRFGVVQRARMWAKNSLPPHILVMTATPIPRTLAMTLYGDLDTSVIDEMPPGRREIITRHTTESKRLALFGFIKKEIALGRQVYIVYPLIEESETLDYNNLMAGFNAVEKSFPLPDYKISILHGRMTPENKEFEMQRFKRGETNIMVSTTVIEVGVDVPNASVMVIESAERFGLSQLHQLRGRVGRGAEQSYCILMTGYKLSADARTRMETMVRTNNGFEIAEVDLQLRGPGDLSGTRQSGLLDLKIANLAADQKILQAARHAALEVLENDRLLQKPENKPIANFIEKREKNMVNWGGIS